MVGHGLPKRRGAAAGTGRGPSTVGGISVRNSQPGSSSGCVGPDFRPEVLSQVSTHPESDEELLELPFVLPPEPSTGGPKKRVHADKKLALLTVVFEKRAVLFGQLSPTLENKDKQKAWEDVREKALSLEIVGPSRDWTYVRDTIFGVWKSRSLAKRDNGRRTGAAGGAKYQINAVDLKIFQIIGEDSPVIEGLPIPESLRPAPRRPVTTPQNDVNQVEDESEMPEPPPRKKRRVVYAETADRKRQKQIELLDVEIYFKKLQCMKLERELNVHPSAFTENLPVYEELIVNIEPID